MTVDVINDANKKKIPATGCYDGANRSLIYARKQAISGDKQDRVLRNVSEAQWQGHQSPAPVKYNPKFALVEQTSPKPKFLPVG